MVVVADLLFKVDGPLTTELNLLLENADLQPVNHIYDAVSRIRNKYLSRAEVKETEGILMEFLVSRLQSSAIANLGSSMPVDDEAHRQTAKKIIKQWSTMVAWMRKRCSCMHPLTGSNSQWVDTDKVEALREEIMDSASYADVRDGALMLLAEYKALAHAQPGM